MKASFFGFYSPDPKELEQLWKKGLIVLDTNVLLNLYRLPTTARDELLGVLDEFKDRIWIPHQVALEFQRRRLTVIASERKSTEEALRSAKALVTELKTKVDSLQIDKRGIGVQCKPLLDDLQEANDKLIAAIEAVHQSQLDISSADPIRDRLDEILHERIGSGPLNQQELDALVSSGDERFKDQIPPGFADAEKDKNPAESIFIHDHLRYQRKFGDLILWRQTIEQVKKTKTEAVLFVTADRKEDWWWREQGKTIGPHPELIREIRREGGAKVFWMYSSVQFVEHAGRYSNANVSTQSVDELRSVLESVTNDVGVRTRYFHNEPLVDAGVARTHPRSPFQGKRPRWVEAAVGNWLMNHIGPVRANSEDFPEFLIGYHDDAEGYEVKVAKRWDRMFNSAPVIASMARGQLDQIEGKLARFSLVLVISDSDYFEILNDVNHYEELQRQASEAQRKHRISSIIVGTVIGTSFEPLIMMRPDEDQGWIRAERP